MTKIDANFFRPFVDGTKETLKVMCSTECVSETPFMKIRGSNLEADIAGVIGVSSKHFAGSISICFPSITFLSIMNNMLGEKFESLTADLEDGAAELLNIIFGHAKKILNEQGHSVQMALPTIVRGKGLTVNPCRAERTIIVPFKTHAGPFHVEFGINSMT